MDEAVMQELPECREEMARSIYVQFVHDAEVWEVRACTSTQVLV